MFTITAIHDNDEITTFEDITLEAFFMLANAYGLFHPFTSFHIA